jgi:hypothetical protein
MKRNIARCAGESARAESAEKTPKTAAQAMSTGLRPIRSPRRPATSDPASIPNVPAAKACVKAAGGVFQASTSDGTT